MNVKVLFPNKQVELQPLRLDLRLYVSSVLFLCLLSSLLLTRLSSQGVASVSSFCNPRFKLYVTGAIANLITQPLLTANLFF